MNRHHNLILISVFCTFCCSDTLCIETKDAAKQQVSVYEKAALKWVSSFGTDDEKILQKRMELERNRVIEVGEPSIPHLCVLLKHKQVNVRRGSAIALFIIAQKHNIRDGKLLDLVLRRMIEEDDIKARSNLYHVASDIIKNLKTAN